MTDRHGGYIVALEKDIREDDAEKTLNAIRNIKRVCDVQPIVCGLDAQLARMRVMSEIAHQFYDFYMGLIKGE